MDNLIRVIARDGSVMCCAVDSTKIAGEAERDLHNGILHIALDQTGAVRHNGELAGRTAAASLSAWRAGQFPWAARSC